MRCPDCQKFVSFDTDVEPEVDLQVEADGTVSGTCRIVNQCAECSQELTEVTLEVELDFSAEYEKHVEEYKKEHPDDTTEHELSVDGEASRTERTQTHDRNGKIIKSSPRYRKHYYGAEVAVTVTCSCGETFSETWSDEVQASGMESMV